MYQEKLAVAIKANGKVLREDGDTVYIPFGSTYTLFVKNMNSVRALVRIEIDGTDATEGTSLIVPANGSVELERFIKSGNMEKGQRFKFIERTQKIEDGPRGIKAEDGLIRVEFEFEREPAKLESPRYWENHQPYLWFGNPPTRVEHHHHYHDVRNVKLGGSNSSLKSYLSDVVVGSPTASYSAQSSSISGSSVSGSLTGVMNCSISTTMDSAPAEREVKTSSMLRSGVLRSGMPIQQNKGITVGGGISNQKFVQGASFPTDGVKHVMILKILGAVGEKAVTAPVTVKTKATCPTCGTKNKFGTKFCRECGTGLEKV